MAKHNLTQAAKLAGISRSTIMRHISEGKITKELGKDGKPCIDTSELERAYGLTQSQDTEMNTHVNSLGTPEKKQEDRGLERKLEALRQEKLETLEHLIEELRDERDNWKKEAEDWKKQAQHLLIDQSSNTEKPTPEKKRSGLFGWLKS